MPSDETTPLQAFDRAWWKEAIIYQIYPISFFDSNGDGLGDLNGIRQKLGYLQELGVDVLWLCPIYRSPLADMGYDISDYRNIDPRYGSLEDWDALLKAVHERGMKLIMDLVINHTSDEHEWFLESRSDKTNPKRDWYIWRPPKYDEHGNRCPPNNWRSVFQGSAWEYDEKTDEYYLHLYVSKQPDLNWDNPKVREAAFDVMNFWIERGCDGFRMDVINLLSKTEGLPDAPVTFPEDKYQTASMYFANGPRVHEYIKEMHQKVLKGRDLLTVGETPFTHDTSELAEYALPRNEELQMVFTFELMDIDSPKEGQDVAPLMKKAWTVGELRTIVGKWQTFKREEGFWNTVFIENHDHARAVSRFGNDSDELRARSAELIALLEISQGGTLFVFQGQELGMKNFPETWGIEEYKDVASQNYWNRVKQSRQEVHAGEGDVDMSDVLSNFQKKARDHARVPMQWDATPNAGFTTGTPWMRVNEDYKEWNAGRQVGDPESVFSFYKKALQFRKANPVLIYGDFVDLSNDHPQILAYRRTLPGTSALIVLNFSATAASIDIEHSVWDGMALGLWNVQTGLSPPGVETSRPGVIYLQAYEGRIYVK